eukprot:7798213-Ditylum_brightwellii.AAC.1
MERCRSVQEWPQAMCNIFTWRYWVPCCAIANGYCILCLPTALCAVLSTPPSEGYLGGYKYTFNVEYSPSGV